MFYPPSGPLSLKHHFTASAMIICKEHILLVNHKRIGAWVPPGGHIEEDELPEETLHREIMEEVGIAVDIWSESRPKTDDQEAFFLAQPLYVQSVKATEKGTDFYHVDLAYLCFPVSGQLEDERGLPRLKSNHEVKEARWVNFDELAELKLAKNVPEAIALVHGRMKTPDFRPITATCNVPT